MESTSFVPCVPYPTNLAPRGDTVDKYPSADGTEIEVKDPYRFLEDPDSDATKAWVTVQNQITDDFLSKCDLREKIKSNVTEIWNFPKCSLPKKHGDRYYFQYNTGLQNQYVMYRFKTDGQLKPTGEDVLSEAELFLDPNTLSTDGTAALGSSSWSDDGQTFAYQVKKSGSDWATIHVKKFDGTDLDEKLEWVKFSGISWTKDNAGFFYGRYAAPKSIQAQGMDKAGEETEGAKFQKLYYHIPGTAQDQDILIHENKDEAEYMFGAGVSNDGKYVMLHTHKNCDDLNTIHIKEIGPDTLKAQVTFEPLIGDWLGGFDYIHNVDKTFYFKTNYKAGRSRVVAIDLDNPAEANWKEIIPEHEKNVLQGADCMNGMIVASYLQNASDQITVFDFDGNVKQQIKLPGIGTIISMAGKHNRDEMLYKFSSFTDPGSMYRCDLNTFEVERIGVTKLSESAPNIDDLVTDQVWYESKDGTKVPMFVVRRKDVLPTMDSKPEAPIPTVLYGYGGFNISITPYFSVSRLVFLNNLKGMLVIASIRGGGEFGEEWHKQGTKERKQNCFDDFIAAGEHLIAKEYTDSSNLVINGGSNGGLLVAACANQRPELFAAGVSQVPVTDMMRFHKFTIGYAWCSDFGCSEKEAGIDYLVKYSPLHCVKAQKYPAMLVTTADHDDRVVPLHTYKYVAELQHTAGGVDGQRPLLTRIEVKAGHGAGKPTTKIIEEVADMYGFISKVTGAKWHD